MQVSLDHIEDTADHIKTLWFKTETPLRYVAGQFIEVTLPHDNPDSRGTRRWFTVSSSPTESLIAITTKAADKPSSFMRALFGLKKGDSVTISDAMGDFVLPKDTSIPLMYVVGGIGVTPVRSMIKWLQDNGEKRDVYVMYMAHSDDQLAFKPLLDNYCKQVTYTVHEPSTSWTGNVGRITSDDIYSASQKYNKPFIFLSGPEEMIEVFVAELTELGINPSRLITDYFPGYNGSL
jgi:ferredoxin-NADP reductase